MCGLGLLLFLAAMGLTATGGEGAKALGSIVGFVAFALIIVGIALVVVGLFRKA